MPNCNQGDCTNKARCLGMCNKHYIRERKARIAAGLNPNTAYVLDTNDFWQFVKKELAL